MTNTELGRVRIIEGTPPCSPGKCVMCGTTEGPFFDIGFEIDFYGVVYFCFENCFREIANAFDYISPRQWKSVKALNSELREKINLLIDENQELRDAVGTINTVLSAPPVDAFSKLPDVDLDPESSEDSGEVSTGSTEGKNGSTKQINESRSADVQRDDSLDDFLDAI